MGPYASDRHASDRPGSRLAVVSHASSRSDKELPPIAERPTESSRVPGAWGKMPEPDEFEDLPEAARQKALKRPDLAFFFFF